MIEYIKFWLALPAAAALLLALILGILLVAGLLVGLVTALRQQSCKHVQVSETQACDAVCTACGKNLGFIGKWRAEKLKKGQA